jgi:hypothetical protein
MRLDLGAMTSYLHYGQACELVHTALENQTFG